VRRPLRSSRGLAIERELYLALLVDRDRAHRRDGLDRRAAWTSKEVASTGREDVTLQSTRSSLAPFQSRKLAFALGLTAKETLKSFTASSTRSTAAFLAEDCSLLETPSSSPPAAIVLLDAKVVLDDNAEIRHPSGRLCATRTRRCGRSQAKARGPLSYVSLDVTSAAGNGAASPWAHGHHPRNTALSRRTSSTSAAAPQEAGKPPLPHPQARG